MRSGGRHRTSIRPPTSPSGTCPAGITNAIDLCVRANVYRNQSHGSALPTFFAHILGITSQGVQATATARVLVGNSASCMRPWALTDKWYDLVDTDNPIEGTPTWTFDDKYERYFENGPNRGQLMPGIVDCYHAALTNLQGPYIEQLSGGHRRRHELPGATGRRDCASA